MDESKFPPGGFRDSVADYLSRPFGINTRRVSVVVGLLIIAGISIALWAGIAALVIYFII
jgi:hypothetical protein